MSKVLNRIRRRMTGEHQLPAFLPEEPRGWFPNPETAQPVDPWMTRCDTMLLPSIKEW